MNKFLLMAVAMVLFGCSSPNVKQMSAEDNQNKINIGYSLAFAQSILKPDDAVFVRLNFDSGVKVAQISNKFISPASSAEEVVAFSKSLNMLGPAFGSSKLFSGKSFSCALADGVKKDFYHPCGTGSRFAVSNKISSVGRNIILLPFTWGLAVGLDYAVDTDLLQKIYKDVGLLGVINDYIGLRKKIDFLNSELDREDLKIKQELKVVVALSNLSGFSAPAVEKRHVVFNLARQDKISQVESIFYNEDHSFDRMAEEVNDLYKKIKAVRRYKVTCPSYFEIRGFNGVQSCPESFIYKEDRDGLVINVRLDSFSPGVRFPSVAAKDASIKVEIKSGGELFIYNLTDAYIEIKSISIYGGGEISDNLVDYSLSPQGYNKSPFYVSALGGRRVQDVFNFKMIKMSDVASRQLDFGVAVKYRIGNGVNFNTLFVKKKYGVLSFL